MKTITRYKLIQPVENIINHQFREYQIVNYYGPKGCGKSLLLDSLQAELSKYDNIIVLGIFDFSIQDEYESFEAQLSNLQLNEHYCPLLLIDNLDSLFYAFENTELPLESALSDFIEDQKGIIVCTTTKKPRFKLFSLIRKLYLQPVPSFSTGDIEEIALINSFSSKTLHKLSLGHPATISWIIDDKLNSERDIYTAAINYFLGDIEGEFVRELACICCLVPYSTTETISYILGEDRTSRQDIRSSTTFLADQGLLDWDSYWGCYSFSNDAARRLCSKYFALYYSEYFRHAHLRASEYFADQSNYPKATPLFSLLSLYHRLFAYYPKFETAFQNGINWVSLNLDKWLNYAGSNEIRSGWETAINLHSLEEEIVSFIGDNALIQLLESTSATSEKPNNERRLKVFLCHSSSDKSEVRKLFKKLFNIQGVDPWLDEAKILPEEDWDREITIAVKESDAIIVCISQILKTKEGYVQKEIKRVLDVADEKPDGTIFVIPLKLEECEVPERLSKWQWLNYHEKDAFDRLLLSLSKRANTLGIKLSS